MAPSLHTILPPPPQISLLITINILLLVLLKLRQQYAGCNYTRAHLVDGPN